MSRFRDDDPYDAWGQDLRVPLEERGWELDMTPGNDELHERELEAALERALSPWMDVRDGHALSVLESLRRGGFAIVAVDGESR